MNPKRRFRTNGSSDIHLVARAFAEAIEACYENPDLRAYFDSAPFGARLYIAMQFYREHFLDAMDAQLYSRCMAQIEARLDVRDLRHLLNYSGSRADQEKFKAMLKALNKRKSAPDQTRPPRRRILPDLDSASRRYLMCVILAAALVIFLPDALWPTKTTSGEPPRVAAERSVAPPAGHVEAKPTPPNPGGKPPAVEPAARAVAAADPVAEPVAEPQPAASNLVTAADAGPADESLSVSNALPDTAPSVADGKPGAVLRYEFHDGLKIVRTGNVVKVPRRFSLKNGCGLNSPQQLFWAYARNPEKAGRKPLEYYREWTRCAQAASDQEKTKGKMK